MRPCLETGCPELVERGRCERHQRAKQRRKESQPHRAVYHDTRWDHARRARLQLVGHQCEAVEDHERCDAVHSASTPLHGHHHPTGVRELLQRGLDPFRIDRFVMLCDRHHGIAEHEGHAIGIPHPEAAIIRDAAGLDRVAS